MLGGPKRPRVALKAFGPRLRKDEVIITITETDEDDYSITTDDSADDSADDSTDDGDDSADDGDDAADDGAD